MKKIIVLSLLLASCTGDRVYLDKPGVISAEFDVDKSACVKEVTAQAGGYDSNVRSKHEPESELKKRSRELLLECMRSKGWLQQGESREQQKIKYPAQPLAYPDPPKGIASPKCLAQCRKEGGTEGFCQSSCEANP